MIKKNFEVNKINLNNERFFLIYGVNEGAKKEKVDQLHQDIKKENIHSYDEKQILESEENFLENIFSKSLFENEKYIKIDRATDKIFRIINIGTQSRSYFAKLFCYGFASSIFIYIAVNMSMVLGLLPIVGSPLPIMSYGGSSMLATMLGLGIVMSSKIYSKQLIA